MRHKLFKIFNCAFTAGTFSYYMVHERYPLLVLQALTYQVIIQFYETNHTTILQGMLLLSLYTLSSIIEMVSPSFKSKMNNLSQSKSKSNLKSKGLRLLE